MPFPEKTDKVIFNFESPGYEKEVNKRKNEKPLRLTEYRLNKIKNEFDCILSQLNYHQQEKFRQIRALKGKLLYCGLFNQLPAELQTRMTLWGNMYGKRFD